MLVRRKKKSIWLKEVTTEQFDCIALPIIFFLFAGLCVWLMR